MRQRRRHTCSRQIHRHLSGEAGHRPGRPDRARHLPTRRVGTNGPVGRPFRVLAHCQNPGYHRGRARANPGAIGGHPRVDPSHSRPRLLSGRRPQQRNHRSKWVGVSRRRLVRRTGGDRQIRRRLGNSPPLNRSSRHRNGRAPSPSARPAILMTSGANFPRPTWWTGRGAGSARRQKPHHLSWLRRQAHGRSTRPPQLPHQPPRHTHRHPRPRPRLPLAEAGQPHLGFRLSNWPRPRASRLIACNWERLRPSPLPDRCSAAWLREWLSCLRHGCGPRASSGRK